MCVDKHYLVAMHWAGCDLLGYRLGKITLEEKIRGGGVSDTFPGESAIDGFACLRIGVRYVSQGGKYQVWLWFRTYQTCDVALKHSVFQV